MAEERERKVKVVLDEVLVPGYPKLCRSQPAKSSRCAGFGLEFNEKAGRSRSRSKSERRFVKLPKSTR